MVSNCKHYSIPHYFQVVFFKKLVSVLNWVFRKTYKRRKTDKTKTNIIMASWPDQAHTT